MKLSAKNVLAGRVSSLVMGAVNAEIGIEVAGGQVIFAMITKSSVEHLGLRVGGQAYAVIKASQVIVGVD